MEEKRDIFDDLRRMVSCTYISDMRFSPYKERLLKIFRSMNTEGYSREQLKDMEEYIHFLQEDSDMKFPC